MDIGLYASSSYIDNYGMPSKPEDMARHRTIGYGDQLATLPENRWLNEHAGLASQVLCSDSTSTRLEATIAGVGISVQPHLFAKANPQLVRLLDEVVLPGHEMWLVFHNDLRHLARIRAVVEFITSQLVTSEMV